MRMPVIRWSVCTLGWLALAVCVLLVAPRAEAAPEARILRIDPRASQESGSPILNTVIEVVQPKRVSDAVQGCAALQGDGLFDCMSAALEAPFALYTPFGFPAKDGKTNAVLTVVVDGSERPAEFVSAAKWGDVALQPGVGTAWLIMVDADKRMGAGYEDARQVALKFIASLGPNDIVNVMFFNDRQVVQDSHWLAASDKAKAEGFVTAAAAVYPSQGRNRSLLTIIKTGATDAFRSLGNVGSSLKVPMHQALVLLSSGFGGTDPSTTGPGAMELSKYLTRGRFPEDNTALPKTPVPVISVYFPAKTYDEFRQNSLDFMQNLANPEIGGFFTVMRAGQGGRAAGIVNAVRTRFSKMHLVKWRVSCIAPSVTQSFNLFFRNVNPTIVPDGSFKDVPIGIDPTTWPLDVNIQYSQESAKRNPVYPGGKFKLYGNFCWGGDKSRAEVYFMPVGQQLPADLSGADVEKAKQAQQQLIQMEMKGEAVDVNESYAEFLAPDKDKILNGSGKLAVVRLVVFDSGAKRTSGVTADSVIQLQASEAPLPLLWILVGAFALVMLFIMIAILVRGSGRKRGGAPAPAAPGYPGAPPPYGMSPGYGMPPAGAYGGAPPAPGYGAPPPVGVAPVPMAPMAAPPAVSPQFMYGAAPGATPVAPHGAYAPPAPPDPYAQPAAGVVSRAILQGAGGVFTVTPGAEINAGRDGSQCGILLSEPRVSAVHATVKLEGGQLFVRDGNSNNGTVVNGNRLPPGQWTPVPNGSLLRFGPAEFSVRLE
jgi:hypothetical protein